MTRKLTRRPLVAWLLAVSVFVVPYTAKAQPAPRVPRVVVLTPGLESSGTSVPAREAFERGLKEYGWVPGKNIRVEFRYAEGTSERLETLTREIVQSAPDVIVARASGSIRAVKRVTNTIPIVMSAAGYDPVTLGIVESLARPGGNVTGLTLLNSELPVKQLQLLKEIVPHLGRVGVLGSAAAQRPRPARERLTAAAKGLGIQLQEVEVQSADGLDQAFTDLVRGRVGGLLVLADPFVLESNAARVVALAEKHRLPTVYWLHIYPEAGGLMSYGADLFDILRRSASYVDRILRGARPGELPVEEPTKFSLIVNAKAARTLGLTIPPSVMARVNEIIQ